MKQRLKLFFVAMLAVVTASAYDFKVDGIYYDINGTSATVTYGNTDHNHNSYSGNVVIPETVSYNGISYKVTTIGGAAFWGCNGLTEVTIPESVTSIGNYAFYYCTGLTEVTIPESVTSIGNYAFYYCTGLTEVTIPESVTTIGYSAFAYCTGLTTVNFNAINCTSMGDDVFGSCDAFSTLNIGENVTNIPSYAFRGCTGLTEVTIPNSVTTIGYNAFEGCKGLTRVDISDLEAWCNIGFRSSDANPLNLAHHLYINGEEVNELVIPSSVNKIGDYAFSGCAELTSVTIPNSVTSIGGSAFSGCTGLTEVTIPNSVTSIGGSAFRFCSGLMEVTIPNSVTTIGYSAFSGTSLQSMVVLSDKKITQGGYAFDGVQRFKLFAINNNIIDCENTELIIIDTKADFEVDGINYKIVSMPDLTCKVVTGNNIPTAGNEAVNVPATVEYRGREFKVIEVDNGALVAHHYISNVTLPSTVEKIGNYPFYGCPIEDLKLENGESSLTLLGNLGLDGVKKLYVGRNLSDWTALNNNENLVEVSLGETVTEVGNHAFDGCSGLETIKSYNLVPPVMTEEVGFSTDNYFNVQVYVPALAYDTYIDADVWKGFWNIGKLESSIEVVHSAGNVDGVPDIYNLQGVCIKRNATQADIDALAPGLYIIGGKKVLVK